MDTYLIWLAAGFLLVIVELVSGTFYLLVLGVAALAGGLGAVGGPPVSGQGGGGGGRGGGPGARQIPRRALGRDRSRRGLRRAGRESHRGFHRWQYAQSFEESASLRHRRLTWMRSRTPSRTR